MLAQIKLGEISVDVVKKDIKNIHLSVYPPNGKVRISAPLRMDLDTIRVFAISKLGWIKQQQQKMRAQDRETPREYIDRGRMLLHASNYSLNLWGQDIDPVAVAMCKINGALYAPWLSFPLPQSILGTAKYPPSASLLLPEPPPETQPIFRVDDHGQPLLFDL